MYFQPATTHPIPLVHLQNFSKSEKFSLFHIISQHTMRLDGSSHSHIIFIMLFRHHAYKQSLLLDWFNVALPFLCPSIRSEMNVAFNHACDLTLGVVNLVQYNPPSSLF